MTTLDAVPRKKPEPSAEEPAARELVRLAPTEATGQVQIDVPGDRDGSFAPQTADVAAAAADRGR